MDLMTIKKVGILVGGGPAPGTNGVISAVVIEAIKSGCVPIGFHDFRSSHAWIVYVPLSPVRVSVMVPFEFLRTASRTGR